MRGARFAKGLQAPDIEPSAPRADSNGRNPLESYFDSNDEGPGIWKWRHYFDIYHRHLSKFVGREVHLVEVGIFSGGSLRMWQNYFGERCRIYGVDIEPACVAYASDSVHVFIGDQSDPRFWRRFREQVPLVDVVIDDGGHEAVQQVATLEALLPHMRPGGVYICEDTHETTHGFHAYVDGFSRLLHTVQHQPSGYVDTAGSDPTGFQEQVKSVHRYPFMTVIEKPDLPVAPFECPRHGTEWQPFLG